MPKRKLEDEFGFDSKTIPQILHELRVPELKSILGNLGLSRQGRKQDLIIRINSLLAQLSPLPAGTTGGTTPGHLGKFVPIGVTYAAVKDAVREAYSAYINSKKGITYHDQQYGVAQSPAALPLAVPQVQQGSDSVKCICGNAFSNSRTMIQCDSCSLWLHTSCLGMGVESQIPVGTWHCPLCRSLTSDPFVEVLETKLKPISVSNRPYGRYDTKTFSLTNVDFHELIQSTSARSRGKGGSIQLHVRCMRTLGDVDEGHCWPQSILVRVNYRCVFERAVDMVKKKSAYERPLDISSYVQAGTNTLDINLVDYQRFCVLVQKVRLKSNDDLIQWIRSRSQSFTEEDAKKKVAESFGGGGEADGNESDIEIVATSTNLSLRDPLALSRMKIPSRGKDCPHLQCFDVDTYLQFNRSAANAGWKCPVCHKTVMPKSLIIDPYFEKILKELESDEDAETIELRPDGSWSRKVTENRATTRNNRGEGTSVETVKAEEEEETSTDEGPIASRGYLSSAGAGEAARQPNQAEVIDLIDSDDDEFEIQTGDDAGENPGQNGSLSISPIPFSSAAASSFPLGFPEPPAVSSSGAAPASLHSFLIPSSRPVTSSSSSGMVSSDLNGVFSSHGINIAAPNPTSLSIPAYPGVRSPAGEMGIGLPSPSIDPGNPTDQEIIAALALNNVFNGT